MRMCKHVAARHNLKVVFLTVGFQVIRISHSDAVIRCVMKSRVYANYISHCLNRDVTFSAIPQGALLIQLSTYCCYFH